MICECSFEMGVLDTVHGKRPRGRDYEMISYPPRGFQGKTSGTREYPSTRVRAITWVFGERDTPLLL